MDRMAGPGCRWRIRPDTGANSIWRCWSGAFLLHMVPMYFRPRSAMKTNQQSEILRRLHCTAGHLNAVIKMVEDNETCEQVLHQLVAVDAAIRAAGIGLIVC